MYTAEWIDSEKERKLMVDTLQTISIACLWVVIVLNRLIEIIDKGK